MPKIKEKSKIESSEETKDFAPQQALLIKALAPITYPFVYLLYKGWWVLPALFVLWFLSKILIKT